MGQPRNKNNVNNPLDDFISEGSTGQSDQLGFHGLFICAVRNYSIPHSRINWNKENNMFILKKTLRVSFQEHAVQIQT